MTERNLLLLLLIILTSCIEPIQLEQDVEVDLLIVEGGITTEEKVHEIRLSRTAKYGSVFSGVISYETGALVFVRDNLGNLVQLEEEGLGVYQTPETFAAILDRSYVVIIETNDGEVYQSIPQLLVSVPEIDSVFFEFYEDTESIDPTPSGVNIVIEYTDDNDNQNYYKWETTGTYKIETSPELYVPPRSEVPVPKDCCDVCFLNEVGTEIKVSSDRLYNGNTNQQTIFIEDDGFRFYEKYIIEIDQLSISLDAYQYFDLLIEQLSISGDIFDPPPAQITGNILNVTDPDEDVIGFFTVSDVNSNQFEIYAADLPELVPLPIIPDDCREVNGATTVIPSIW